MDCGVYLYLCLLNKLFFEKNDVLCIKIWGDFQYGVLVFCSWFFCIRIFKEYLNEDIEGMFINFLDIKKLK